VNEVKKRRTPHLREQPVRKPYELIGLSAGTRWLVAAFAVTLMTLLMIALAWYGRRFFSSSLSFSLSDLTQFIYNPYWLGYALQITLIPIALLYIFSHTWLFQHIVSGAVSPDDQIDLTGVLVVIQLLTLGFEITLIHSDLGNVPAFSTPSSGCALLIPLVGGLLGGCKTGVILGLNAFWIQGTHDFLFRSPPFDNYRYENVRDIQSLLDDRLWWNITLRGYLTNMRAVTPVWSGIVAGIGGNRLGRYRFSPMALVSLVTGVYTGAGLLIILNRGSLGTMLWLPSTLTSGLGLMVVGLMIGNVRSNLAQRKAEAAELAVARAELRALRAQINPHFLFNALNTIRYFVRADPPVARQLLLDLSQILQRSLRSEQVVPLRDELDYVRAYLALEKARFNERLQIEWSLAADDYLDHPVPVLILQPVVENAVLHGISPKPGGGQVHISIRHKNGNLVLQVEDNGTGIDPCRLSEILALETADTQNTCVGLRNVDGRLRALYGDQHALSIHSEAGQGTRVQITIPTGSREGGSHAHPDR
jgi:hypothetical protein